MRTLKCYGTCNQKYPKEMLVTHSNKNYCVPCRDAKVLEQTQRQHLHTYINMIFNTSFPPGYILKQIKQFQEERNYTLENMYFTLKYITEIKKIPLQLKHGISMVPHFYDETITYRQNLAERREALKGYNPFSAQPTVVRLSQPVIDDSYKRKKLIDMESLLK